MTDDLEGCITRATGPDRELERDLLLATGHTKPDTWGGPRWFYDNQPVALHESESDVGARITASIDDAVAFVERVLGRPSWRTGNLPSGRGFSIIGTDLTEHEAASAPLALCLGAWRHYKGKRR